MWTTPSFGLDTFLSSFFPLLPFSPSIPFCLSHYFPHIYVFFISCSTNSSSLPSVRSIPEKCPAHFSRQHQQTHKYSDIHFNMHSVNSYMFRSCSLYQNTLGVLLIRALLILYRSDIHIFTDSLHICYESSSSVICQTTGPKSLPKRFLHIVRSRASSFN